MRLLESLMNDYVTVSKQLAYYIGRKIPGQIDKYEREQHEAAVKLIVALAKYHGVTEDIFESEMRQSE